MVKKELEYAVFKKLRNLSNINVKLTFYDITSKYFYAESRLIDTNGYSRNNSAEKKQIIIAVLTTCEGYPIKHYVFEGGNRDESTVAAVIRSLRRKYRIEEASFVGDQGMLSNLNLGSIEMEGFDYIMGVKHHQDEIFKMLSQEVVARE